MILNERRLSLEGRGNIMKNIAIIPARSGSKGLKNKNIKLFNGKPLMWYSIDVALQSGCFDEVMVSTDSEKYADIAKACGAEVPFLRTKGASADNASSWAVVREVIEDVFTSNGLEVTFKAKPILGVAGSGKHTHVGASVKLKDGSIKNLFAPLDMNNDYLWAVRLNAQNISSSCLSIRF